MGVEKHVDNALLKLNGISVAEETKTAALNVVLCPRCRGKNSPVSKFCARCGSPTNIQTALEVEQMRSGGDEVINELVGNSEIQQIIIKKIMTDEQFRAKLRIIV